MYVTGTTTEMSPRRMDWFMVRCASTPVKPTMAIQPASSQTTGVHWPQLASAAMGSWITSIQRTIWIGVSVRISSLESTLAPA